MLVTVEHCYIVQKLSHKVVAGAIPAKLHPQKELQFKKHVLFLYNNPYSGKNIKEKQKLPGI